MSPLNLYTPQQDAPAPLRITEVRPLKKRKPLLLPLLWWHVDAGFPSPVADFTDEPLDLNELVVKNPPATFMMRCTGRSMESAGIHDGDLLVVDRSKEARTGSVVIAYLNGELTVKRLERRGRRLALVSGSDAYPPIAITEEMDFEVWGVVPHVIRDLER